MGLVFRKMLKINKLQRFLKIKIFYNLIYFKITIIVILDKSLYICIGKHRILYKGQKKLKTYKLC